MTYTSCIRIVEKAYGKTCQISRIQCYVYLSLPRKITYNFNSRITRWLSTFKQRVRKDKLDVSKIQQTVAVDLRTSNILISALPTIYQLISKTFHLEGNQRILKTRGTVYRKYPSLAKTRDGESSSMQHHASGASKKWLISPFIPASAAKREKHEVRAVDKKYKRKETKQDSTGKSTQGSRYLFRKLIASQQPPPIK